MTKLKFSSEVLWKPEEIEKRLKLYQKSRTPVRNKQEIDFSIDFLDRLFYIKPNTTVYNTNTDVERITKIGLNTEDLLIFTNPKSNIMGEFSLELCDSYIQLLKRNISPDEVNTLEFPDTDTGESNIICMLPWLGRDDYPTLVSHNGTALRKELFTPELKNKMLDVFELLQRHLLQFKN